MLGDEFAHDLRVLRGDIGGLTVVDAEIEELPVRADGR